ncbi:MAG: ATP-binding protein [Acidimicrobiaceae bacterium]|nr:ATP-binding protein [Acidimicrobiaceae bacterium]
MGYRTCWPARSPVSTHQRRGGGGGGPQPPARHPVYRYETSFGGGKTHGLIALWHLAKGARPSNIADFVDPSLLPDRPCAVATVVGDRLDPVNGLNDPSTGISTYTFWGEVARQLDPEVWSRFERSDRERTPPGKQLWMDAFERGPTLIVIDELALHLAQLASSQNTDVRRQEEATIQALKVLFEAATAAPAVRLIFTLATGTAAFAARTDKLAAAISSVSLEGASEAAHDVMARSKGAVGRPADDHEIGHILRRRLFEHVDSSAAEVAFSAYKDAYGTLAERDSQPLGGAEADPASYCERIRTCYPFHPALIDCLDKRIGPLPGFQRARGALKLLAESLAVLWSEPAARRASVPIINLGDLPLQSAAVRSCITGGINRAEMDPPALADFAGESGHAVAVDSRRWPQEQMARRACTAVFCHSIAGESHGATAADVCLGTLRPHEDPALLDEALGEALKVAWHLHFDSGRWRFRVEPNANKIVATEMANVSHTEITDELESKVRSLFAPSGSLHAVHFPAAPGDVADAPRLQMVVVSPAEAVKPEEIAPPRLVRLIADRSGAAETHRTFRNGLVFVVAEKAHITAAREKIGFEMAARRVVARQQKGDFSFAVVKKLKELAATAALESRMALSRAYQHVWWPERASSDGGVQLRLLPLPPADQGKASGAQTDRVLRLLRDYSKVRDSPPATDALARSSGFDQGGEISTEALARSPWRDPSQAVVLDPALIGEAVAAGVRNGTWVCHDAASGTVFTRQDPPNSVRIAEDVMLYTIERAGQLGLLVEPSADTDRRDPPDGPTQPGPAPGDGPTIGESGASSNDRSDPTESRVLEAHGSAAAALQKLDDAMRDAGAQHLSQVAVRVSAESGQGVQPFRVLGMCVPQLARFDVALKLDATAEFMEPSGAASIRFEGSAAACTPVFEAFWGALSGASDVAGSLTLTASQADAIAYDGPDFRQFAEVLRRAAPGHVTLSAKVAETAAAAPGERAGPQ